MAASCEPKARSKVVTANFAQEKRCSPKTPETPGVVGLTLDLPLYNKVTGVFE
jgi:hypothetical protein